MYFDFNIFCFVYTGAAGVNYSIAKSGCSVLIQWNRKTYSEFYIVIRNKKNTNYFIIETNNNRFSFGHALPGQEYQITWFPIENQEKRNRIDNLKEEITVPVPVHGMFIN